MACLMELFPKSLVEAFENLPWVRSMAFSPVSTPCIIGNKIIGGSDDHARDYTNVSSCCFRHNQNDIYAVILAVRGSPFFTGNKTGGNSGGNAISDETSAAPLTPEGGLSGLWGCGGPLQGTSLEADGRVA